MTRMLSGKYNYIGQMSIGYELYEQLDGKIDAFCCAVGFGATLLGIILALAEKNVNPLTLGVVPIGSEVYLELQKNESDKGELKQINVAKKW